jgi:uncharacterized membrane protein YhaH (DUF805 family)
MTVGVVLVAVVVRRWRDRTRAFPIAFLVLVVAGVPTSVVCAASWAGYLAAAHKSRQP